MKSSPFVLTSTDTYPAATAALRHTTAAPPDASCPRTTVPFRRHCRYPSASDAAVKPLPYTVSGVPPSAAPCTGHTDDTATACAYVYAAPPVENCCPLKLTSTDRADAPATTGDTHSSCDELKNRAATEKPPFSPMPNRHASDDDSRKCEPSTVSRVPPSTGPSSGSTRLTDARAS